MAFGIRYFNSTYFLAVVTFLQSFQFIIAERCSYTSFGELFYYTCLSNQYCCGRSSCCFQNDYYYSVYDLWYFWFCVCFGIFICSLASGAYYRKRQLRSMQVTAFPPGHGGVRVIQGQGMGDSRDAFQPPQRNLFVTTTAASGQPIYPQGYYDVPPPNYHMYNTLGGPVYPAYACYMPPPPSYSSLNTRDTPPSSTGTTSALDASEMETPNRPGEVPPVSS